MWSKVWNEIATPAQELSVWRNKEQLIENCLSSNRWKQSKTKWRMSCGPVSFPLSLSSCCLRVSVLVINLLLLSALLGWFSHESCSSFASCSFPSCVIVCPNLIRFTPVLCRSTCHHCVDTAGSIRISGQWHFCNFASVHHQSGF